jgi:hypothetical protein
MSKSVTTALQLLRDGERTQRPEPAMWGFAIIGFGKHQYLYKCGQKTRLASSVVSLCNIVLYTVHGFETKRALRGRKTQDRKTQNLAEVDNNVR